jgi:hypothetical protein
MSGQMVMANRTRSAQKILDSAISLMMLLRLLLDALLQLFQSRRVGERRESKIVQRLKSVQLECCCKSLMRCFSYLDV